jgi:hypothetical protein
MIISIDAKSTETFEATANISTAKPFVVAGGSSYNTTINIRRENGLLEKNVEGFVIKNSTAFCSYKGGESRGVLRYPVDKNPGVANLFKAIWLAIKAECEAKELPVPQDPVSKDSPKPEAEGGGFYPDSAFCKANVESTVDFVKIIIYHKTENGKELLLSDSDVDSSTIKFYANKASKDRSVIRLLDVIYDVKVTVNKNKVEHKMPAKLKNTKALIESSSFPEIIKPFMITLADVRTKNYYVDNSGKGFYTLMSSYFDCDKKKSADSEADNLINEAQKEDEGEPEIIDPADIDF